MVSAHEVKLAVINNPGVKDIVIARMVGVNGPQVWEARKLLNINRKSKPADCVG